MPNREVFGRALVSIGAVCISLDSENAISHVQIFD